MLRDALEAAAGSLEAVDPVEVAGVTGTRIAAHEAAPAALAAFLHHPSDPIAAITFALTMGARLLGPRPAMVHPPERLLLRLEDCQRLPS